MSPLIGRSGVGVVGVGSGVADLLPTRNFWLTQGRECSQHLQPLPETVADVYEHVAVFSWAACSQGELRCHYTQ